MDWTAKLARPVKTTDGGTLRTLSDARSYLLAINDGRETRNHWQAAADKLMKAAHSGHVEEATRQMELALLNEERLIP